MNWIVAFSRMIVALALLAPAQIVLAQVDPAEDLRNLFPAEANSPPPKKTIKSTTSNVAPVEVVTSESSAASAASPADPELLTIRLADGTAVTGKLSIRELSLDTEFGKLVVPITKLKRLTPGLESRGALLAQVNRLIEQLGGTDEAARDAAQQALLRMGPRVAGELRRVKSSNAEFVKRLNLLLAALAEEHSEDPLDAAAQPWARGDTLETSAFTVVGRVSPQSFTFTSPYGKMNIELSDIESMIPAKPSNARERVFRTLNLAGSAISGGRFVASGVRVERGDVLTVNAEGTITGSSSSRATGPDGNQRLGNVNLDGEQVLGGTLIARIDGKRIKIGSSRKLICEQAGMLYFGMALDEQYARRGGFGGEFRAKIHVEPAGAPAK